MNVCCKSVHIALDKEEQTARGRGVAKQRISKMVLPRTLFTACSGPHSYGKETFDTGSRNDNRSWSLAVAQAKDGDLCR